MLALGITVASGVDSAIGKYYDKDFSGPFRFMTIYEQDSDVLTRSRLE